jgi:hypothetical protein
LPACMCCEGEGVCSVRVGDGREGWWREATCMTIRTMGGFRAGTKSPTQRTWRTWAAALPFRLGSVDSGMRILAFFAQSISAVLYSFSDHRRWPPTDRGHLLGGWRGRKGGRSGGWRFSGRACVCMCVSLFVWVEGGLWFLGSDPEAPPGSRQPDPFRQGGTPSQTNQVNAHSQDHAGERRLNAGHRMPFGPWAALRFCDRVQEGGAAACRQSQTG